MIPHSDFKKHLFVPLRLGNGGVCQRQFTCFLLVKVKMRCPEGFRDSAFCVMRKILIIHVILGAVGICDHVITVT